MAGAVTGAVPRAAATGPAHRLSGHQAEPRVNERGGDGFPLWPAQQMRVGRNQRGVAPARTPAATPSRPGRQVRPPLPGLIAILLLGLVAGFFAWVSAEPLLLAAGHAERGTATVTGCSGSGIRRQCVVSFQGPTFSAARATLVGGSPDERPPGSSLPASMVSSHGRIAYAGGAAGLHARWAVDVALVLLTGLAIAWASGARRLPTRRDRVGVTAVSLLAPLLFLLGMIIAAW
jgi:hypothetical protein